MYKATILAAVLITTTIASASADVTISAAATQNMTCTAGVCAPTASDAVLNVTDLENMLASGNVTVNGKPKVLGFYCGSRSLKYVG